MDGAGRFLRSLNRFGPRPSRGLWPTAAFAGGVAAYPSSARSNSIGKGAAAARFFPSARRRPRDDWRSTLIRIGALPGLGLALNLAFFACVGLYGAQRGGEYDAFVKANGAPADIIARSLGFGVEAVTISGQIELSENQILQAAGVDSRQSLLLLDASDMRRRLMTVPLVKNAQVRKLLPNRLMIEITERTPYAVWQKDGVVSIVAADGAPIDEFSDERYTRLPFVVGDGANLRIDEYLALLDAAGDLRARVRAGLLMSQRRWTLSMTNGVDVLLPEIDAADALRRLARLESESHILEKDIVSLDFRTSGRLYVRLTEEAAAARDALAAHKGGHK